MKNSKILLAFLVIFLNNYATNLYVATNGNDLSNGSLATPFNTIQHALDVASSMTVSMQEDINIYIKGGTYELSETIEIKSQHSGKNGYFVNLRAYLNDDVIISGGKKITNQVWTNHTSLIKKITIPSNVSSNFRNLYINGERRQRARSEGRCNTPFTINSGESWVNISHTISEEFSETFFNRTNFPSASDPYSGIEFVCVNSNKFRMFRWTAHQKNNNYDVLYLSDYEVGDGFEEFAFSFNPEQKQNYLIGITWVENALELLDNEGEWYFNPNNGTLYYYNVQGESIDDIEIPCLEKLMTIDNSSFFRVKGINFAYTSFELSRQYGYASDQAHRAILSSFQYNENLPAALEIENGSNNIEISSCSFRNLGADAINIKKQCNNIDIIENSISDISGSAIVAGDANMIKDGGIPYSAYNSTWSSLFGINNIKINFNKIKKIGNEYYNAVGIYNGFSMNTTIKNNFIDSVPYCGMFIGWGLHKDDVNIAKNNIVSFNKINFSCMELKDGGAIYVTGYQGDNQEGTKIHNNLLTWNIGTAGVYLDHKVEYTSTYKNIMIHGNLENSFFWVHLQDLPNLDNVLPQYNSIYDNYTTFDGNSTNFPPNNYLYGNIIDQSLTYESNEIVNSYTNLTGDLDLSISSEPINEFSQKPEDFNGSDMNLSVFQTLLVPDL